MAIATITTFYGSNSRLTVSSKHPYNGKVQDTASVGVLHFVFQATA